jgi:hypothetical protein
MFGRKDNNRTQQKKDENNRKAGDNYPEEREENDEDRFNYHINHLSGICHKIIILLLLFILHNNFLIKLNNFTKSPKKK